MNTTDSVTRLGFDLRGLMALTAVAAFIALASKIDPGSSLSVAAIFVACAMMAHLHPVGSSKRHWKMGLMFVLGFAIACLAYAIQYLIFGYRVYVMLGTALAICIGVAIGAAALCRPAWLLWSRRASFSIAALLFSYLTLHCILESDSIRTSLHSDFYYTPRYQFTGGKDHYSENWLMNRLRIAFGLTDISFIVLRDKVSVSDLRCIENLGLDTVSLNECNFDLPKDVLSQPGLTQNRKVLQLQIRSSRLRGTSLSALIAATNPKFVLLRDCEVESFEGISQSSTLVTIYVDGTDISDVFVDEVEKSSTLKIVDFRRPSTEEKQVQLRKAVRAIMRSR